MFFWWELLPFVPKVFSLSFVRPSISICMMDRRSYMFRKHWYWYILFCGNEGQIILLRSHWCIALEIGENFECRSNKETFHSDSFYSDSSLTFKTQILLFHLIGETTISEFWLTTFKTAPKWTLIKSVLEVSILKLLTCVILMQIVPVLQNPMTLPLMLSDGQILWIV